jgi:hypothetical protein
MILWFVKAKCSCKRKKRDIQRCLKQKGIESVISNIEKKKTKETILDKKEMQRNKPLDYKKKKDKIHQKRKAHPSMPLENIEQTASPSLISNLLDSIIDKTISITMTLLSRFRRWPYPCLETSQLCFLMRRVLLSEQMDRLSRTVTTLTTLSPIVSIFCFSEHRAVQRGYIGGHT